MNVVSGLKILLMKKIFYQITWILLLCSVKSEAQYYITTSSWTPYTDSIGNCIYPPFVINTNAYSPGLTVETYYGNGSSSTSLVYDGGGYGYAKCAPDYTFPGTYTLKHVLLNGTTPIDSVIRTHEHLYCNTVIIKVFDDITGTGIYDSASDPFAIVPIKLQVSKNGVVSDTVTVVSGIYFRPVGIKGDTYSFKVISLPSSFNVTNPTSGIIYDTIEAISNSHITKYIGLQCTGTGFDLKVFPQFRAGNHYFGGTVYISSSSCVPAPITLSMQLSPKYNLPFFFHPTPTSISGNTVTWNIPSPSYQYGMSIFAGIERSVPLKFGDTLMTSYMVSPISGDADPSNNIAIRVDTVKAGFDPNEMSVTPSGYIPSGSNLKYTIGFENTGNDTAFNISVYDTLSPYVDPQSLDIVMASNVMNIAQLNKGFYNIVKFDFPNINLLDSSHHGQCDGAVIFTINTKQGMPNGTEIYNRAGIYFDYNDVVMTNTVENIIGLPSGVKPIVSNPKVELYPNPANDELTIVNNNWYNSVSIANTLGQVVLSQSLIALQTRVNIKTLSAGMYYVTLRGENGITVQKLIKE
jgi:hypothetical protein